MKQYEYCIEQDVGENTQSTTYYIMRKQTGKNWETYSGSMTTEEVAIKKLAKLQSDEKARVRRNMTARRNRQEKDSVMKSLGLTKVRGFMSGKTYWE